jgi:HAD superfamily hydrolase (TIGR01490 family)
MKRLALFDFDGTITEKDSFLAFIIFCFGRRKAVAGLIRCLHVIVLYKAGLLPNGTAKRMVFSRFFKGMPAVEFEDFCLRFSSGMTDLLVRPEAAEEISGLQAEGTDIVIVSASLENYLSGWCADNSFRLVATKIETSGGCLTGGFASPNCYGEEKVRRIKAELDIGSYDEIYAYGDTKGDLPMLELAHKKYYKPFRGDKC